ncbi:MAG: DotU family type IV/VI secretion system protein [Gemmatimonadota bacterium]|nr:DotU family type IV/VI secretion system protein [Gemmatimonadota bacterium]
MNRSAEPAGADRPGPAGATGRLAQCFQEALTVVVRIRANRQAATDPGVFRRHIKQLLFVADSQAREAGYGAEDVRSATYACVAFIDESVLNSSQAMFAGWARQPLQEEIFEHHTAGEIFFDNLRELLGRRDSGELADLLEVYQLCLLLGFRGRYVRGDSGELRELIASTSRRIEEIRGRPGPISPRWAPPRDEVEARADPWIGRLGLVAAGTFLLGIILFVAYRLLLGSHVDAVIRQAGGGI